MTEADRTEVSMLSVAGVAEDKRVVSVAVVPLSPEAPVWEGAGAPVSGSGCVVAASGAGVLG
ncbi:hypothetical protein P3H15_36190 [Rhodococcus sp. T2V]|uniref:hypothetical protein n=1 Tax=Rhodococcus sp. T2V TaxID=3034164 RepID=UPI0023E16CD9|nr:hypothetical protein [Rhodococcus sp. T2V]MDF3310460.1 hypothetical protein [Rhodococcus sp. T2V]